MLEIQSAPESIVDMGAHWQYEGSTRMTVNSQHPDYSGMMKVMAAMTNTAPWKLPTLLSVVCGIALIFAACATTPADPFEARLTAMSDEQLVSYYHGINDRLKDIQAGTRETDRQGSILREDHLARMPYIIGGEAWELEQKEQQARRELIRRNMTP